MLESFAATFLNKFLGSYVENFDANQLEVGIWNGDVKLKNCKIKKDCLDSLDLPITIEQGILGNLTMQVPWSRLKSSPVKIEIEDIYLLIRPNSWENYDPTDAFEREFNRKMNKLEELELINQSSSSLAETNAEDTNKDTAASDKNTDGFTTSLINKIVDNVQVSIKNIHIRYEDFDSVFSRDQTSIGIFLQNLSATTCNENWEEVFIETVNDISRKIVNLDNLGFYIKTGINTGDSLLDEDVDVFISRFKETVVEPVLVEQLIHPISGACKLSINKKGSTKENPRFKADMDFDAIGLEIYDSQYQILLDIMTNIKRFSKSWKFKDIRPQSRVIQNPREWFKYTINCVITEIRDKNRQYTWDNMKHFSSLRKEYIDCWKKKLLAQRDNVTVSKVTLEKLDELHKTLSLDEIMLFRSLTKKQILKDRKISAETKSNESNSSSSLSDQNINEDNMIAAPEEPIEPAKQKGWLASWWGPSDNDKTNQESLELTEEQKQEFYDAIEYDESNNKPYNKSISKDVVTLNVSNNIKSGFLRLKTKAQNETLSEFTFVGAKTKFYQKPESFGFNFELNSFSIKDKSSSSTYSNIVKCNSDLNDNAEIVDDFFKVYFEKNPIDNVDADSSLTIKLNTMSIYYNPHFIKKVVQFFKTSDELHDTLSAIIASAGTTVEGWAQQTRLGLESVLEDHKNIDVNLDLKAPLIILPIDSNKWDSACVLLDAGNIKITSDLISKSIIEDIKNLSVEEYSHKEKEHPGEFQRFMFDRFKVNLSKTQLLVGPDIKTTIESLKQYENGKKNSWSVINNSSLDILFDVSIFPKALEYSKFKMQMVLPHLDLELSDYQYRILLQVAQVFGFQPTPDDEVSAEQFNMHTNKSMQTFLKDTKEFLSKLNKNQLNQKQFEMNVEVGEVSLNLKKRMNLELDDFLLISSITGSNMQLAVDKYYQYMDVQISLHELLVTENTTGQLKKMVYCTNSDKKHPSDLFKVSYKREQRIVQYNEFLIDVYDQFVDIGMSSLELNLNSNSIFNMLAYVRNTFTDVSNAPMPTDILKHNDDSNNDESPQKMIVNFDLEKINLIFEELDDEKIAALSLSKSSLSVYMVPEKMKVSGKLKHLELVDLIYSDYNPDIRNLISMDNSDGYSELKYETFDCENSDSDITSSLYLKTSSVKVKFMEQCFGRIVEYFNNLQNIKSVFDKARSITFDNSPDLDSIKKMKIDVIVESPIVEFPSIINPIDNICDNLIVHLGKFTLSNNFKADDLTSYSTSLTNMKVASYFNFVETTQFLHMIENLDIKLDMAVLKDLDVSNDKTKHIDVSGIISNSELKLTNLQIDYVRNILKTVASTFTSKDSSNLLNDEDLENKNKNLNNLWDVAMDANAVITPSAVYKADLKEKSPSVDLTESQTSKESEKSSPPSVNFTLSIPITSLTLYDNTENQKTVDECSLTKIALNGTSLTLKKDSSAEKTLDFQYTLDSFAITDLRSDKENVHSDLIPLCSDSKHQVNIIYSENQENHKRGHFILDNMKVILAVDYLIAMKVFWNKLVMSPVSDIDQQIVNVSSKSNITQFGDIESTGVSTSEAHKNVETILTHFTVEMLNPSIVLLANPDLHDSEAFVLKLEHMILNKITDQDGDNISMNLLNAGMFMCNMNTFDKAHIRLVDDFSSNFYYKKIQDATSLKLDIEDMIIRVALRDIRLGNKIFRKTLNLATTSGLFGSALAERLNEFDQPGIKFSREFKLALAKYAPSVLSSFTFMSDENQDLGNYSGEFNQPDILITDENFEVAFGGARLVIIGDVSELPMLDFHTNKFNFFIKDWTTDLNFSSKISFYTNVFNYTKSDWEPLIEPYTFSINGFRGRKNENDTSTAAMNINIESENSSDITISHQSLKLLKMIPESLSLSTISGLVQLSRDETKPFKIQNDTGITLEVWVYNYQDKTKRSNFTIVKNGESIPWEFEDWIKLRENLDTDNNNSTIVFKPEGDDYNSTFKINTKTEIQTLFKLEPPIDNIHSRIECTIKLNEEGVKVIHFTSPLKFTNATSTDLQVFYNEYDSLIINKNSTTCIPLDKVYDSVYQLKPIVDNADYSKSYAIFGWKDVVEAPTNIKSKCYNDSTGEYFYFNVSCQYNPKEKLAKVFPHMEIIISAPFMIENTLPVESHFNIVSKETGENINFNLKSGAKLSIHNINFAEDMVFMKVFPFDTGYTPREYTLIQAPSKFNLPPENITALTRREAGIINELKLSLSYKKDFITGSTIVKIFAAFVILNKTSRPIYIKEKNKENLFLCPVDTTEDDDTYSTIQMISLENYAKPGSNDGKKKKGLVQLKMNDTEWSSNISLNTVGKTLDITLPIASKTTGNEIGVSIEEGSGVFSDTKIVTITPRYIVTNFTECSLVFHETMCMAEFLLEKKQNIPIYKMSMNETKYCRIKMFDKDGLSEYSEPFELNMKSDIDYIKLKNPETGKHTLIMIEKLIEGPAMFINLKNSQSQWPFSVRNFTENNFTIYQRDPRIRNYTMKDESSNNDYNIRKSADIGYYRSMKNFEPKKYNLTEYSIMPFSWDYPSAKDKKLIVEYGKLTRTINMEMIGSLKPMILNMGNSENGGPIIIEINILADGPCLALVFTKYNPEVSLYKINSSTISGNNKPPLPARRRMPANNSLQRTDSSLSLNSNSEIESRHSYDTQNSENDIRMKKVFKTPDTEKSDISSLKVLVNINGIGISIINKKLQELLYLKVKGVEVRYNASKFFKSVSWKLKWFQIDNQLFEDNFKHVLYPTVVSDRKQDMEKHPLLSGSITRVNDETTGMTYIKHATALIQELSLKLDEEFVIELLQFFDLINIPSSMLKASDFDSKIGGSSSYTDNFVIPYLDIVKQEADFDKDSNGLGVSTDDYYHLSLPKCNKKVERKNLHFENLHIQPTVLHFSFMRSESIQLRDNGMDLVALTQKKKASSFLNALYMTLGNISDAPVVLNSLIMENYKTSSSALKESVVEHYNNEVYSQLLKLVGYADVLGNPIGLFNNLSNGVADIFYSPYQNGYYMNDRPEELGISISKGGASFLKKSVFGFSDSFAKFTGSVAKGLTAAVNDKNFQRERYLQQRKNRMSDDPNSFGSGFNSLVQGVASGFNGIASNPMEGAKKEGASGFFKGLGKGLVGMPTKTMIGILDMANNVSDGIKTSTGAYDPDNVYNSKNGHYENNVKSLRYPRYVSKGLAFYVDAMDGLITPYDEAKAYGQYVLKTCKGGEFLYDNYVDHEYLPGNQRIVIVSEEHLLEYNLDSKQVTFVLDMEEMCKVGAPIDDGRQIIVRGRDKNSGRLCQGRFPIIDLKAKERILTKILLAQSKVIKNMDTQL